MGSSAQKGGNGTNYQKKREKKRSFWRSTIFDHLPSFSFGDYKCVFSKTTSIHYFMPPPPPPPFENPGSTTDPAYITYPILESQRVPPQNVGELVDVVDPTAANIMYELQKYQFFYNLLHQE